MVDKSFVEIYDKFKLKFYRSVFELVREREGSLSAMEAFSLEVINMLSEPTVGQFADFLNISQSNATYKVASLIRKGYLTKENSGADRREYYLVLTPKYYGYVGRMDEAIVSAVGRAEQRYTQLDLEKFAALLDDVASELGGAEAI